jgi:hypothetical protein
MPLFGNTRRKTFWPIGKAYESHGRGWVHHLWDFMRVSV